MNRPLSSLLLPTLDDARVADVLRREAEAHPGWADVQNRWGLCCLADGDLDGAERAFDTALGLNPNYGWASLNRAVLQWIRGDRTAARERVAAASSPAQPSRLIQQGWFAVLEGDAETAHTLVESIDGPRRARPDVQWLRTAVAELADRQAAPRFWQELLNDPVLREHPETVSALRATARADDWRSALFPGLYQLWFGVSELLARFGQYDEARSAARMGYVLFSDATRYRNQLGFIASMEGDEDAAVRHHEAALAGSESDPFSAAALARHFASREDLDLAHRYLRIALDRAPQYADLQRLMGQVEMARGNFPEALGHVRRALSVNPRYKTARIEEASILFHLHLWKEAERSYRQAMDQGLVSADVLLHLGRCLELRMRPDEAETAYEEAVHLNERELLAHYRLSRLHRAAGRDAEADDAWERTEALCSAEEIAFLPPSTPMFVEEDWPLPARRAS